jgi:hypothetical protein
MRSIRTQTLYDDAKHPVAVQIPYAIGLKWKLSCASGMCGAQPTARNRSVQARPRALFPNMQASLDCLKILLNTRERSVKNGRQVRS